MKARGHGSILFRRKSFAKGFVRKKQKEFEMIKRALLVDAETTGLNAGQDSCIEVGAILYSVQNRISLVQYSCIIPIPEVIINALENPESVLNAMSEVNHISDGALWEMLECYDDDVHAQLDWMAERADVIVAHNAAFDKAFLKQAGWDWSQPAWVCTAEDFEWPKSQSRSRERLTQIAIAYGVPVVDAHRALDDCKLIAALFDKRDDLQEAFELAMRPKELYVANVSYDDRQLAKDCGFIWNEIIPRKWAKRLTVEQAQALSFPVCKTLIV